MIYDDSGEGTWTLLLTKYGDIDSSHRPLGAWQNVTVAGTSKVRARDNVSDLKQGRPSCGESSVVLLQCHGVSVGCRLLITTWSVDSMIEERVGVTFLS